MASDIDVLMSKEPGVCSDIEIDNYYGLLECMGRISEKSEKKLNERLIVIRQELKSIDFEKGTAAFEKSQKSWERYKKDLCEYQTSGIEPEGSAFGFKVHYCNASENYRRLETLKDEPSFP